jgi:hypothetical protein
MSYLLILPLILPELYNKEMFGNVFLALNVLRGYIYTWSVGFVLRELHLPLLELRYILNLSLLVVLLINSFVWSSLKWSMAFWPVTPCNSSSKTRCFRGTHCLLLQGRRVSEARNKHDAFDKLRPFEPEVRGDIFFWNVGLSLNYTLLHCETIKSNELRVFTWSYMYWIGL